MTDEKIVDMYWDRSEDAITETEKKYGTYCQSIAYRILNNIEDSMECVNDTYLKAWNSMPVERPNRLAAFLGKITKNLALDKYEYYTAEKRGGIQTKLALDELSECISGKDNPEKLVDKYHLEEIMNSFLRDLSEKHRNIFVARYWHLFFIGDIAARYSFTESDVRTSLHRSREKLRKVLKAEGFYI